MLVLVLGVALFAAAHVIPLTRPLRSALAARIGDGPVKGIVALTALVGVAAMAWGYGEARFTTLRQAEGGALLTRASGGYLVIWGAAFAATTVLGQVDRGTPHTVGAALQVGAVATALVSNAALFLRLCSRVCSTGFGSTFRWPC